MCSHHVQNTNKLTLKSHSAAVIGRSKYRHHDHKIVSKNRFPLKIWQVSAAVNVEQCVLKLYTLPGVCC